LYRHPIGNLAIGQVQLGDEINRTSKILRWSDPSTGKLGR
jgi:hypothetical protein